MKRETLAALKKKLDTEYSWYIRLRDHGTCYTCGTVKPPKEMQAGHYISRTHLVFRWDDRNVHCQCYACNCMKHGDLITYREKLVRQYGELSIQLMESRRFEPVKLTAEWYHGQIDRYREINRRLERE